METNFCLHRGIQKEVFQKKGVFSTPTYTAISVDNSKGSPPKENEETRRKISKEYTMAEKPARKPAKAGKKAATRKAATKKTTTTSGWVYALFAFLGLVVLALSIAYISGPLTNVQVPPIPTPAAPPISSYPLAGQSYSSPQGSQYDAVWTVDGRLWQPSLPVGNLRVAHTVATTLEVGKYAFDAVECALFVDASRNGKGANNPMTVGYGNDLRFSVNTTDGGQAYGLVQCRGNASTGFQIRWLGK